MEEPGVLIKHLVFEITVFTLEVLSLVDTLISGWEAIQVFAVLLILILLPTTIS